MKWNETTASKCRYGDIAGEIWGDWEILWEDSESDYQGHASFLAKRGRSQYCYYEWWYGSCSGCDTWEAAAMDDKAIEAEMRKTAAWFKSKAHLIRFLDLKSSKAPPISNHKDGGICGLSDILSGGLRERVDGMRKAIGLKPFNWEKFDAQREPSRPKKEPEPEEEEGRKWGWKS